MGCTMDEVRYGRLCLLTLNTCPARLRRVIDHSYSRGVPNFEVFLNNNIHHLFHLRFRNCCCSNNTSTVTPLNKSQWDLLFTRISTRNPHGRRGECPCQYKAILGVTTNVLDITLCCLFLCNICPGISQQDVVTIRQVRNDLIHANAASIDEQTFKRTWSAVEKALLNLSRLVSPIFETDTQDILQRMKDRVIDPAELEALKQIMTDHKEYEQLQESVQRIQSDQQRDKEANDERDGRLEQVTHRLEEAEGRYQSHQARLSSMEEASKERDRKLEQLTCRFDQAEDMYQSHKSSSSSIEALKAVQTELIHGYKDITESVDVLPFGDSAGLSIQDIFVPLLMEEDLATKERFHKPDASSGKMIENIKDLFYANDKTAKRIFIKGEAGSGKTLFCIKLLDAWCRAKHSKTGVNDELQQCLSVFDLVFYIPLRHVSKGITYVKDMVEKLLPRSCLEQLRILSTHCLVILDGLDEWPSPKGYTELPKMYGLVNCTLLCTMRPWKLTQLKIKFKPHDKIVQLLGLKPKSVETLITHVLANFYHLETESDEFESRFTRYLSMTKQIEFGSLLAMPMMATTFCCMWYENDIHEEKEKIQTRHMSNNSMTYSYLSLMEAMIRRADEKHELASILLQEKQTVVLKVNYFRKCPTIPNILKQFPYIHKYIDALLPLCRLAYNDLVADDTKLVFDKQQIEVHIGHQSLDLALKVGLISQAKAPGRFHQQNVSINFYHKSVEEVMAAIHIACGTSGGISSFCSHLSSVSKIMEQGNMIRFVMGLHPTGGFKISEHVTRIMNQDDSSKYYRQNIFSYYDTVKVIYREQCQWYREIVYSLKLTSGSLPACSIHVTDIYLDHESDSDAVKVTGELMYSNRDNIVSVMFWYVRYPQRDVIQCLPRCTKLSSLCVMITNIKDHDLLVMALPHLPHLENIDYTGNCTIPVPAQAAAVHAILQLKQIKRIYLSDVDLVEDTVVLTRDMIRLETLGLYEVNMSAVSWNRFISDLLSIQHPVDVKLWDTNIDQDTRRMVHTSSQLRVKESYDGFFIFTVFQNPPNR